MKLKFNISEKKEIETYFGFLKYSKRLKWGKGMEWAFYKPHPSLRILKNRNLSKKDKQRIVQEYVVNYYKKYLPKIKKGTFLVKNQWQKKEKGFFSLANKIFKNYPWPKGKYIAYPTIWGIYPRDIKNKTFQFPFRHKIKNYPVVVIAHEMLHFIFYDYFYAHYPKFKKTKYNFKIWNISEAFNIVIQNSSEWVNFFRAKCKPYPEHKNLIKEIKKLWQEKKDIDCLFKNLKII